MLDEAGCIFITIDDNEFADLKLICDEVFGHNNFITSCMWQKIHSIKNDAKFISVNHDYVFVYAKNIGNGVDVILYAGGVTITEPKYEVSDVNLDGTVDVNDVTYMQMHLAGYKNADGSAMIDTANMFRIAD